MNYLLGIFFSFLCMLFVGGGDFTSGLASRRLNEKVVLITIFFFQTLCSLLFWVLFVHSFSFTGILLVFAAIAGLFQTFGLLLFYKAMAIAPIALVSPIFATASVITILYGIFFLHEPISSFRTISLLVILIGTILASSDFSAKRQTKHTQKGVIFAIFGSIIFGIGLLFITQALKQGEFYTYNTLYAFVTFASSLFFFRKTFVKNVPWRQVKDKSFLLPLLVGGLYATANTCYGLALKIIPSYLAAAIFSAYPFVTVLLGFGFLKEKLKPNQNLGIVLIILGLISSSLV